MRVELPLGDVVDRISILRIKRARISDVADRAYVSRELEAVEAAWAAAGHMPLEQVEEFARLEEVNGRLWDVEDALRAHEARGDFGDAFVALARSVYALNDERAALKRAVNEAMGSRLLEIKSYGRD